MIIKSMIHVGEEVYDFDELEEKKQIEIANKLNKQALEAVGFRESSKKNSKKTGNT